MKRSQVRQHAFKIIFETEFRLREQAPETVEALEGMIENYLQNFPEEEADESEKAFIRKEVLGTMEHKEEIDADLAKYVRGWSLTRLNKVDLSILRLAVYEIRYEEDIPASVSINEAVEIAKQYGQDESAGFVNGVLSNFAPRKA